jgi:hypothetical protein
MVFCHDNYCAINTEKCDYKIGGYALMRIIKESNSNKETETKIRIAIMETIDWKETGEENVLLRCALCRMCCVQKVIRDSLDK